MDSWFQSVCQPVLLFVCLVALCSVHGQREKSIRVQLKSSWNSTPLILEVSEFFAERGKLWEFVSLVIKENKGELSESEHYEKAKEYTKEVLGEHHVPLVQVAVATRLYAPRVQMLKKAEENARSRIPGGCLQEGEGGWVVLVKDKGSALAVCSPSELHDRLSKMDHREQHTHPDLHLDFVTSLVETHVYPSSQVDSATQNDSSKVTAVFFGNILSKDFGPMHMTLAQMAEDGKLRYILHPVAPRSDNQRSIPFNVQGYGVQLVIKSTEYSVIDDSSIESSKDVLVEDAESSEALAAAIDAPSDKLIARIKGRAGYMKEDYGSSFHEEEGKDDADKFDLLGIQIAGMIAGSSSPLTELCQTVCNLPMLAPYLGRLEVNESAAESVMKAQERVGFGQNLIVINGNVMSASSVSLFSLLGALTEQAEKIKKVGELGVSAEDARRLLAITEDRSQVKFVLYEEDQLSKDGSAIIHLLNDIEADAQYAKWPKSVTELLKPAWPGQPRHIRRNLVTGVFLVDLHRPAAAAQLLLGVAEDIVGRGIPMRAGVLLYSSDLERGTSQDVQVQRAFGRAYLYALHSHGMSVAAAFLKEVVKAGGTGEEQNHPLPTHYEKENKKKKEKKAAVISMAEMERVYSRSVGNAAESALSFGELMSHEGLYTLEKASSFMARRGLSDFSGFSVFLNGLVIRLGKVANRRMLMQVPMYMAYLYSELAGAVREGSLSDATHDITAFLKSSPGVLDTYSKLTSGSSGSASFVSEEAVRNPKGAVYLDPYKDEVKHITHLVVMREDTAKGRQVAETLVSRMQREAPGVNQVRAAIFRRRCSASDGPVQVLSSQYTEQQREALAQALSSSDEAAIASLVPCVPEALDQALKATGNQGSEGTLVVNGRIVPVHQHTTSISVSDVLALEKYERLRRVDQVYKVFESVQVELEDPDLVTAGYRSSAVAYLSCMLARELQRMEGSQRYQGKAGSLEDVIPLVKLPPKWQTGVTCVHVDAILDPVSREAQRVAPLLWLVHETLGVGVSLILSPGAPSKPETFYRPVFQMEPSFDKSTGNRQAGPGARFANLPQSVLLTMGLDTPFRWLVEPIEALHDLDNILLKDISEPSLDATFVLDHVLLEGNCADLTRGGNPPRGLELELMPHQMDPQEKKKEGVEPLVQDTIVMANLGYLQLKANPGVFTLQIAQGRGRELFTLVHTQSLAPVTSIPVVLDSWDGSFIFLKAKRLPGMEHEELLLVTDQGEDATQKEQESLWSKLSNMWSQDSKNDKNKRGKAQGSEEGEEEQQQHGQKEEEEEDQDVDDNTINIFSIASGHLYERFLKIMMLSVVKNTQSPVKFWFVKNFLSPQVKAVLPRMAKKYNCSVELVTYKWPGWLHQEKEKQRLIWGHKILFLDVLFPLSVKKIIFVDADQIVRGDMKQLHKMDLQGKVYGFTPFCDSRPEMDGFRFWKHGYWESHLQGLPYHISALFVVDLDRFRGVAAGDRIRATYAQLSNDPGSLSNLDQDLPNFLQHTLPIHSLPQEWLWCETWCSDQSKAKAKTIDLCNNPLTKTPKLENAVRIVPEVKQTLY